MITHCWFKVPVDKVVLVHECEALGYLRCDACRLELRERSGEEALQVPVFKVFHGYEDHIHGLEPAKGLDEIRVILSNAWL
jgi:hypothetical protein